MATDGSTPTPTPTYFTRSTTPPHMSSASSSSNATKPTLLAFHGSGSNATIHTVQLARLNRVLKEHFHIEVLQAPFPSPPGPGILPFFDGCGPYARWLPPSEKVSLEAMRSGASTAAMSKEVETLVRNAVNRVNSSGGRVVGLVGFSQGTKVVAGLLRAAQVRREVGARGEEWVSGFRVGVSVCGSYAPGLLPGGVERLPEVLGRSEEEREALLKKRIEAPVLHVQGEQDEWKWAGDGLIAAEYEQGEGKSEVVTWDMGHHYPQRPEESERIRDWLLEQLQKLDGEQRAA